MGTRLEILMIGLNREKSHEVWNETVHELRRLDRVFNRFDEGSETSKINREAASAPVRVSVSPEMWAILQNCRDYHTRTQGLFDITLNDFTTVIMDTDENSVVFSKKNLTLDFGGYAKGYALAKIKGLLLQNRIEHCFVDFGNSSILGMGHHPHGDSWKVSVRDPYHPGTILGELSLHHQALSVSGNSPGYNGHIVRPDSGLAVNARKVTSIISKDPLDAEVLSTVFMMANEEEKKWLAREFKIEIEQVAEYIIQEQ
ncbi:MAG: FAD:protein FMN transferase [Firmicutes bacterium]|nr:FAD:protein FMN transferase [Bacillota bacterium]